MAHNLKRRKGEKETIGIINEKTSSKNSTHYFTTSAFSHIIKMIENTYRKPICKQQIVKMIAQIPDRTAN